MKDESTFDEICSFEIKKIIIKRTNFRRNVKYLIRWLKYDFEKNLSQNFFEYQDALNLEKEFDITNSSVTFFIFRKREKLKSKSKL